MSTGEIHVGDVGTMFIRTIKDETGTAVDISTATVKQILFKPPSGALLTKTAQFVTDGTDGRVFYMTIAGDLSAPGPWRCEAYVEMPAWEGHSDIKDFEVYANLA